MEFWTIRQTDLANWQPKKRCWIVSLWLQSNTLSFHSHTLTTVIVFLSHYVGAKLLLDSRHSRAQTRSVYFSYIFIVIHFLYEKSPNIGCKRDWIFHYFLLWRQKNLELKDNPVLSNVKDHQMVYIILVGKTTQLNTIPDSSAKQNSKCLVTILNQWPKYRDNPKLPSQAD